MSVGALAPCVAAPAGLVAFAAGPGADALCGAVLHGHSVRSAILRGTLEDGVNMVTGRFEDQTGPVEYRLQKPDRYLRIRRTLRPDLETREGFSGTAAFTRWSPGPGVTGMRGERTYTVPPTLEDRFEHLVLGTLCWTDTAHPYAIVKTSGPTVQLRAADGTSLAVDLDAQGRPRLLRYRDKVGLPGPPADPKATSGPGLIRGLVMTLADMELLLDDRHLVDGVDVPFHITESANGTAIWDLRLDAVVLNPPLGPKDFR